MKKHTSILIKVASIVGTFSVVSFAGLEPSPFLPIWKIIIIIIGG